MNIPKIIFKPMSLEQNIDIIKWLYFEGNGDLNIYDRTIEYFPELSNIDKELSKDEIYSKIESIVTSCYLSKKEEIEKDVLRYSSLWENYNDEYFSKLTLFLECDWPENVKEINASVGLIPVFPRHLDSFSFEIGTNVSDEKLLEVCAHETLHFLWFRKWKELYPDTKREEYESPHFVWKYSEMVTDPVLNNKPFSLIFDFTEYGYNSFYKLKYKGIYVMDELRNIYSKEIPVEEKIRDGFEYLEKALKEDS